jgi:hypothetical protein
MRCLRPEQEIHERRALGQRLALLAGDAAEASRHIIRRRHVRNLMP